MVGLDVNGYLTSPTGIKVPAIYIGTSDSETQIHTSTSATTGSTMPAGGTSVITASTSGTYTLAAPVAGVTKALAVTSSSTLTRLVNLVSGTFLTSAMSTGAGASITEPGLFFFQGISTSQYMPVSAYTTSSISYA